VFSLWFAAEAKPFSMDRKRGRRELQRPSPLANRDRGTGRSGTGMGAYAVLVMAGNSRRSSTALLLHGADRGGFCLGDDEHAGRMVTRMEGDKRR
jgi:hypothetical protein